MCFVRILRARSRKPSYDKNNLNYLLLYCKRPLSHDVESRISYIDEWFSSIVKQQEFYDDHANSVPIRRYFYNVDLQGRLFLEETLPKNIATSIKDVRFQNFFFRQIRRIQPPRDLVNTNGISPEEYPFVSPCGKELNFIRPAATPIVFHTLQTSSKNDKSDKGQEQQSEETLVYAGSMTQPFVPSSLAISRHTGRLYHHIFASSKRKESSVSTTRIAQHTKNNRDEVTNNSNAEEAANARRTTAGYALIRSSVVVALSDRIQPIDIADDPTSDKDDGCSGMVFLTEDGPLPIPWLPEGEEPGPWSMPYNEDAPDG